MASFPNSLEPVTGATENVGNAPDDENEDEDDYFDRLQSYVDAVDDDYKEDEDLEINAEKPTYHTEDEYFSAVLSANTSIESNLVLPEDSMVWTFLMRDIALSTVNKTHSGFTMVGPDDTSIIAITRQWLFNNLPSSSHLFCFIGVHMMNLVSANDTYNSNSSSSCSPTTCAADLCPYRLWVNDVTNPTIVLAVKFPAPSFRDNEINVSCFYDPSLEPGLNNLTADSNTHLVNWKSVCKEIVGTVESEWERIRYVRDESVLSPSKKTLSIMLAGVTHSFHHFFVECCGIVREEIKSTNPNRDCLSPNSSNHLVWNEEFFVPCGLFVADSMILAFEEEVEAPAGYSFTDLRPDDAEIINSCWPYHNGDSLRMVHHMIATLPSVGIRHTESNRLVCWTLTYSDGSIGMLHTEAEHRKKGLARCILQKMLTLWRRLDWQCAAFAFSIDDNPSAHSALIAAGFQRKNDSCWFSISKEI